MIAASKGYENITRILIDAGADVNIKNDERNTALILATNNGHENISRILISSGAFETRVDYDNEETKSNYGDQESEEEITLISAAKNGDVDTLWDLISLNNIDYNNTTDENGMNALMWGARNDHYNIVKQLIDVGADPNLGDNDGKTALIHAVLSGNKEIVEYLLDNNADITLEDDEGIDAITYAQGEILYLLRDHFNRHINPYDQEEDSGENYYEGKYIDEKKSPRRNRDGEIIREY